MCYNDTSDRLYVCTIGSGYNRVDVFNHELILAKSISTSPYSPVDIEVYNSTLYIVTTYTVLVYQNEIIIKNFSTLCASIISTIVDNYGNHAILCSSNIIYLYSVNGTYLGLHFNALVPSVTDMSFDSHGDLVLVASNGLFIMSNFSRVVNNTGLSADKQCIVNSMSLILLI